MSASTTPVKAQLGGERGECLAELFLPIAGWSVRPRLSDERGVVDDPQDAPAGLGLLVSVEHITAEIGTDTRAWVTERPRLLGWPIWHGDVDQPAEALAAA